MKTVTLSTVATVFNGKTPSKSEQRSNGHPILKIKDIDEYGFFRQNYASFVDDAFVAKHSAKTLKQGDNLLLNAAHNASYVGSKLHYCDHETEGSIATGEWTVVRPEQTRLNARFLHHWVSSPRARQLVTDLVKGIHLYPKDVARLEIPLPPLEEQKRIAGILDQADALRRLRRRALDRLNTLGQAIFHEMFGDPLDDSRPSLGWTRESLDKSIQYIDYRGKTPPKASAGVRLITAKNVKTGSVNLNPEEFIASDAFDGWMTRGFPKQGDVLFTTEAPLGNVAILDVEGDVAVGQRLLTMRPDKNKILAPYLLYFLMSRGFRKKMFENSTGSTVVGIKSALLKKIPIAFPALHEQQEFAAAIGGAEAIICKAGGASRHSEALFTSLQHRAFRGEL